MFLKISKFFLFASLLSVTVVLTSTFFPFIGGKDYFFRFAVELALVFVILWWAFEAEPGELWEQLRHAAKKPFFIAVTAFVGVYLLATAFALDARSAFWSNYERGEGGFQMLHYYVFFALLILLLRSKEDWRWFFKTFLLAAVLMILYGVFAQLGWADNFISPYVGGGAPGTPWGRLVLTRFQGSLGNPAYVNPYLMFSIFFALNLWVTSKFTNKWIPGVFYFLLSSIFLFFFMLGQTRGAFIGFVIAVFAFLVIFGYLEKRRRSLALGIMALLILVGSVLVHYKNSGFVQDIPGGRMFDMPLSDHLLIVLGFMVMVIAVLIMFAREKKYLWWVLAGFAVFLIGAGTYAVNSGKVNLADPTTSTRFWTWGSAWKGFKERPILGWGPENFTAVFDKYFDSRHYFPGTNTETWFDRAHSIYFDYMSETGILGLLSYLAIFGVMFWELFRRFGDKNHSSYEKALLFAIPVGYLVQGVAIFDVLPIYINVFALFAYFVFYSGSHELADAHNESQAHRLPHHHQLHIN